MSSYRELSTLIICFWNALEAGWKRRLWRLYLLMIFASLAEVISLGALFPFLSILILPTHSSRLMERLPAFLDHLTPSVVGNYLGILFCFAILAATMGRLLLLRYSTYISFELGTSLSKKYFSNVLSREFSWHLQHSSDELISAASLKCYNVALQIVLPAIQLLSALILLASVAALLLTLHAMPTVVCAAIFTSIYFLTATLNSKKLRVNSSYIARMSNEIFKILQEGIGGIREVIIGNTKNYFVREFSKKDGKLKLAQASSTYIGLSPRFVIEGASMFFIVIFALYINKSDGGLQAALPMIGLFVVSAQRVLPLLQQVYVSWTQMETGRESLRDILLVLSSDSSDRSDVDAKGIRFNHLISVKGVTYSYPGSNVLVLSNLNLELKKGEKIGVVGKTGAGKSTFADIIMGLVSPVDGELVIDGVAVTRENLTSWWSNVSHVPQSIYLADSSIAQNVAFGIEKSEIDLDRLGECIKKSQLGDFIDGLPDGIWTEVGERGVRLSGGEIQRIGIARALYKRPAVFVFDEATSSLDTSTETEIMRAIYALDRDLTVIIIAHRMSTLKGCDRILEFKNNGSMVEHNGRDFFEKVNL